MPRDRSKLEVFNLAHALALEVYRVTERLPTAERFGLQGQLRRAAVSVPANLAEGCSRRTTREYGRAIDIALGSAVEVRYLRRLVVDLGMVSAQDLAVSIAGSDHVVRALHKLQRAIDGFEK